MSVDRASLPAASIPSFAHLRRLTDDTGLLEHALGRIPRRSEGYTTDDNARALWLTTEWLSNDEVNCHQATIDTLKELAETYMAFLLWNQGDEGWWHNNIAYDRTPEREERSGNHDCQGRAIWAAADAWVRLEGALPDTAHIIVQRAMPTLGRIDSRRGQAFVMAACAHMIEAEQRGAIRLPGSWRSEMTAHMEQYEQILNEAFHQFAEGDWYWYESALTYSNGIVPWAMLRTWRLTGREETLRHGLNSLSFLLDTMTTAEGSLRPVGNNGWGSPGQVSLWDQQPLEMFKLALALEEAAIATARAPANSTSLQPGALRAATPRQSRDWRLKRDLALSWFHGNNDHRAMMCDPVDGSCCDGLMNTGPNINCGAESTISYLMTEAICRHSK